MRRSGLRIGCDRTAARSRSRKPSFTVHTSAAGILEARLYPKDGFAADNYVALELPQLRSLHVVVYSEQPDLIRPALASDSRVACRVPACR